MKDKLTEIYNLLVSNSKLKNVQIKFYEASENLNYKKPFIIVIPMQSVQENSFGSDKLLSQEMMYQINVESANRMKTKEISKEIYLTLTKNGFNQLSGGLDEYFNETKRFVDARRYKTITKLYDTDY